MRDTLDLKNDSDLRECFSISAEREKEILKYISELSEELNYSQFLNVVWNDSGISDEEMVLIILGVGQRMAVQAIPKELLGDGWSVIH